MDRNAPIGIFDSGVGGLTVARSILDFLPGEQLIYVGDTAHTPYGDKTLAQVKGYALAIMDRLVHSGVKMLVIACNTASCAVLEEAYERYQVAQGIPVVEVIKPAVHRAVSLSKSGNIGVIGTNATIQSGTYQNHLQQLGASVVAQACPQYVPFAEAGITTGQELLEVSREYLRPLQQAQVDTLILGCTHYPLLRGPISYLMGNQVSLVSSSEASAAEVYRRLVSEQLTRVEETPAAHRFICTQLKESFKQLAGRVMGSAFNGIRQEQIS